MFCFKIADGSPLAHTRICWPCFKTDTFGGSVKAEGKAVSAIGEKWEKGQSMIKKGNNLVRKGNRQISDG